MNATISNTGHVVDFWAECHGTVWLLRPASPLGEEWLTDHLDPDGAKLGNAFAVEHRFVQDIVNGALDDGLRVGGS